MGSESVKLQVYATGVIDHETIKREVCDVMEGTEFAFEMRSKRYKRLTN